MTRPAYARPAIDAKVTPDRLRGRTHTGPWPRRGEGVPPLRREAILASLRRDATRHGPGVQGQDALATTCGQTSLPRPESLSVGWQRHGRRRCRWRDGQTIGTLRLPLPPRRLALAFQGSTIRRRSGVQSSPIKLSRERRLRVARSRPPPKAATAHRRTSCNAHYFPRYMVNCQ
jgi:hypothetical protein